MLDLSVAQIQFASDFTSRYIIDVAQERDAGRQSGIETPLFHDDNRVLLVRFDGPEMLMTQGEPLLPGIFRTSRNQKSAGGQEQPLVGLTVWNPRDVQQIRESGLHTVFGVRFGVAGTDEPRDKHLKQQGMDFTERFAVPCTKTQ